MTEQILSILNPVRILKVQDWEGIARITLQNEEAANAFDAQAYLDRRTVHTIMRFEHLASKPLTKEMFVCGVEKPKSINYQGVSTEVYTTALDTYQAALKSVWFDGFEVYRSNQIWNTAAGVRVDDDGGFYLPNDYSKVAFYAKTISDIQFYLSKHNETSDTKIDLRFTESFAEELLK